MSEIPKSRRTHSKLEAQHLAFKIRSRIRCELMATFGYSEKKLQAHLKRVTAHLGNSPERDETISRIELAEDSFILWFIEEERKSIHDLCREISHHIRSANTIFPTYKAEYIIRRTEWDLAMSACNKLQDELQYIAESLPADKNKFMGIVLDAEHLFNELKALRKSDNKRFLPHMKD